jgi:hypothetical protein
VLEPLPNTRIHKYDAENIMDLLNSHFQELTPDSLDEIRKQSALEESV